MSFKNELKIKLSFHKKAIIKDSNNIAEKMYVRQVGLGILRRVHFSISFEKGE